MAWMRFRKKDIPGGLWQKCPSCKETLYNKDLAENYKVCTKCEHHFPLTALERVAYTLDEDSFVEIDSGMESVDALSFIDKTSYEEKLAMNQAKTGHREAMVFGTGRLHGRELVFGALEFKFLGGSMGVVVGEKVTRAAECALQKKIPLLLFATSGGARMHEGALSLMQMAKSCAALARLGKAGGLYVSVLAHPTTGGVTASWATMADLVLAEPSALIGFAGPRVIQTTIRQELPEGFQTSEFLLKKGQLDRIVPRPGLVEELAQIFDYLLDPLDPPYQPPVKDEENTKQPEPAQEAEPAKGKKAADPARKS